MSGSDRPDRDGGEGPEFGWLYGRPDQGEPPPDATRRIPVQPRPSSGTSGPPTENIGRRPPPARPSARPPARSSAEPRPPQVAPTPYQPAPYQPPQPVPPGRRGRRGGGIGGGFWARRVRNPFFWVRFVLSLLLVWVLFTVAVPFVVWKSADQVDFAPAGSRPGEQGGTTYLLIGSDSRKNLSKAERRRLHTGNPSSELTDTMMLLHTGGGPSVLLSIPRDTEIDKPYYSGKINGAYHRGGAKLLVRIIEAETGIRIDKYVEIGLGGVADVVDAVGGIRVCPVERLKDPLAGLDIKKGCQTVDGTVAVAYSRSRHESRYGDLERVRRQREVIGAIGKKVLSPWSVANPVRWWRLNKAVPAFFKFGQGMSALDASRWALAMTKTGNGKNLTCTMPVTDLSAHTWDRDRADPLFAAIKDNDTDKITKDECTPNGVVIPK